MTLVPPKDWGDDLRRYEKTKRHEVHPSTMQPPNLKIPRGAVANAERDFNPITQRFADKQKEQDLCRFEKELAVEHLNRAEDIQIIREQPFNILNYSSRLQGVESKRTEGTHDKKGSMVYPDGFQGRVDYNIISNKGYDEHHWAPPEERPIPPLRLPRAREVASFPLREYNVLTNRYNEHHDEKTMRDEHLKKLELTVKDQTRNKFHPVLQVYKDKDEEDRMRVVDAAHEQEMRERLKAYEPLAMQHRPSQYYNLVNHAVHNEDMLKWIDHAEDERKLRYRTKYVAQHDAHNRGLAIEHQDQQRKMNRVHFDRYKTQMKRGHDIITNQHYEGRHACPPFQPYPEEMESTWKQAMQRGGNDHSTSDEAVSGMEILKRRDNWVTSPRKKREESSSLSPKAPKASNGDTTLLPSQLASVTSPKGHNTSDALPISPLISPRAPKCEPIGPPSERSSPSKGSSGLRAKSLTARGPQGGMAPAPPGKTGPVQMMPLSCLSPSSKTSPQALMPSNLGIAPPAPGVPGTPAGSVYARKL